MSSERGVMDVRRDVRRTLQVFLPTVPGPVLDFATTTVFASMSTSGRQHAGANKGPASGFVLRRLSSGDHGQFDLADPWPPMHARRRGKKASSFDISSDTLLESFSMASGSDSGPKSSSSNASSASGGLSSMCLASPFASLRGQGPVTL